MEEPDRHELEEGDPPESEEAVEGAADATDEAGRQIEVEGGGTVVDEDPDPVELKARLGIKNNHIRELYEQIAAVQLAADEARAAHEASRDHIAYLDEERGRLKKRITELEDEQRSRRRRREGLERQIGRLERELERRDEKISYRDRLLERKDREMEELAAEMEELVARKEEALQEALRHVEGLERDLEERENEAADLRTAVEGLRADLEEEYEARRRLAEPANRLRAGIDLFNESDHLHPVNALSRSLGQPEVHVELEEGASSPVVLSFTWQGITWQTFSANPDHAVEEPRVYLKSSGEDLSGVDRPPPNARVGPGGRVLLGL